jgi:hypothetical protein
MVKRQIKSGYQVCLKYLQGPNSPVPFPQTASANREATSANRGALEKTAVST